MWRVWPGDRCADLLVLAVVSMGIAAVLRAWRGWAWATALAVVWLAALVFFVGFPAAISAFVVACAAVALGSLVVPSQACARFALVLPVGLVLIGGTIGWLVPLPVHRWFLYWPLFLGICAWRYPSVRQFADAGRIGWRDAVLAAPWSAAVAVLVLGLASTGAWLPTMQADDLAYHLGLPTQLQRQGFYALDPSTQYWALAPWLGDVVQGIVQVLAGREARGAINAVWIAATAAGLWRVAAQLGADAALRWQSVAMFASLPLLAALAAGMQTELPASALLVALALVVSQPRGDRTWPCAVLVAGLVGLKFGQAFAALLMLVWMVARDRGRVSWKRVPIAMLIVVVLAGSSYFQAWRISGNPMLPLFNNVFRSTVLAPVQLGDLRWHAGFAASLPWSITFDTERYLEAWDGGFGFSLVALSGAWLLAFLRPRTRGLAFAASAVLLLPMVPMQYARYAFPGLVLLLPAMLVALRQTLDARWTVGCLVALCALNLSFQANANWLLHVNTLRKIVRSGGDADAAFRRYAPERMLIADLRRRDDGNSIVLAMDDKVPVFAELGARGRTVSHYSPRLEAARLAAEADASGIGWERLIRDVDAHWLLLRRAHLSGAARAGLVRVNARLVVDISESELWSVGTADPAAASTPQ